MNKTLEDIQKKLQTELDNYKIVQKGIYPLILI